MPADLGSQLLSGVVSRSTPLITFDCIIDLDFGLINLIYDKYLDKNVFDENFFTKNKVKNIVASIYNRNLSNPLSCIKNSNIDDAEIDSYYREFIEKEMDDILDYSISTEILHLIESYNEAKEISNPVLLCYNQKQLDTLNYEKSLSSNTKILISDLTPKELSKYNQIFIKYLDELKSFPPIQFKMIYMSSCGVNFKEDSSDVKDNESIIKLIKDGNEISVFDIYKKDILERKNKNES